MFFAKRLKNLISEHLATVNMLNSLKNWTTALPSYCLITLAKTELENIRLSVFEILEVFVNTLTADDKYFLRSRKNLPQPIELPLSKIQKTFSEFSAAYLKSTSNVEHFEKEGNPHRVCIFEITEWEICFKLNV